MTENADRRAAAAKQEKKTYRTPNLASYGPVERLTQGSLGTMADGASGMGMA